METTEESVTALFRFLRSFRNIRLNIAYLLPLQAQLPKTVHIRTLRHLLSR
jgi:hypothetical protein